jgi:hypothetical protein
MKPNQCTPPPPPPPPPPQESFTKRPRTQSEASQFGGSHRYKTKQNKHNLNTMWHTTPFVTKCEISQHLKAHTHKLLWTMIPHNLMQLTWNPLFLGLLDLLQSLKSSWVVGSCGHVGHKGWLKGSLLLLLLVLLALA